MLTFQYIPHDRILNLSSKERVEMILGLVKENKLLIIEGRLKSTEEARLIRETMMALEHDLERFHGIEMGVLHNQPQQKGMATSIRKKIANWLVGDRTGITIVGPANIIDELEQDQEHIHIHLHDQFIKNHPKNKARSEHTKK